jgi:hypothetical protein
MHRYSRMKKICIIFSDFFINFVSLYVRYVHDKLIYTGYIPLKQTGQAKYNTNVSAREPFV